MNLGKVVGTVVATRKEPSMDGLKFMLVKHVDPDGKETGGQVVAVDSVGAGKSAGKEKSSGPSLAGELGVFESMDEAVRAASVAFCQYDAMGLKKRNEIIASIRGAMREHGSMLAKMANEETGLGRYDDKILKNQLVTEKT